MRTLKFKAQPTNAFFRHRQSNVRRLLPASDYGRVRDNQIVVHSSDKIVLGSSRKLRGPPNIRLTAAKNAFVGRPLNFKVHLLLKSAVFSPLFVTKITFYAYILS